MNMIHPVELPGGIPVDGNLVKMVEFKPVTGHVELAIFEAGRSLHNLPEFISQLLLATVKTLGNKPAHIDELDRLSVGDRHFLLRELVVFFNGPLKWFSSLCDQCGEKFDLPIEWKTLPVLNAVTVPADPNCVINGKHFCLQSPTGAMQKRLAVNSKHNLKSDLIHACVLSIDGVPQTGGTEVKLSAQEMTKIEEFLETFSVQLLTDLQTHCPSCEHTMVLKADLVDAIIEADTGILDDVHYIASHYHWGEKEILDMPRQRRLHYLHLIDTSIGGGKLTSCLF